MSDYHNKRAKEILSSIIYATVATSNSEGKPWNSAVAYFADDEANIYWFSDKESVHSNNIRANEDIFIIIYDSTMKEGTGEGLYIEAKAYEVNDDEEIEKVANLQTGSMKVSPSQVKGKAIHRFYKAVPTRTWINDDEKDTDGNYVKDIRVEVPLSEVQIAIID